MPSRAPTICGLCRTAHPHGEKCALIAARDKARNRRADAKRPSASARGYSKDWEKAAKAFLAEPGHHLCSCGRPATLVRHRISIRKAPHLRMERSNWQPGCAICNARDYAAERRPNKD